MNQLNEILLMQQPQSNKTSPAKNISMKVILPGAIAKTNEKYPVSAIQYLVIFALYVISNHMIFLAPFGTYKNW